MNNLFNVLDFGAVPDGISDSTAAFQKALDRAGEVFGAVIVPPGIYMCNKLTMRQRTSIQGYPSWNYRAEASGSTIHLLSPNNDCLLDITNAYGVSIQGLCMDGGLLGENVHGILINKSDPGSQEDTPLIDGCQIGRFSGDGIRFHRIWCFSIRHSMIHRNNGHGLYIKGWDGFIMDCWFSGNRGCGIFADDDNASVTATANRIEWNRCGVRIINGCNWNITGNYIDRSGGAGIYIGGSERKSHTITIAGNVIYRSGAFADSMPADMSEYENSQVFFDGCNNLVFSSNTMHAGRDDNNKGKYSPLYGIVTRNLACSIIKDNVGQDGCMREFFVDLGGHGENVKIADNFGSKALWK